ERAVEESLRAIQNVPRVMAQIPSRVGKLQVADLRLTVGRDQNVMIGVDAIRRDVQGVAGIRQRLDENVDLVKRFVADLHERAIENGWLKETPDGTTFTEIITPEEQARREALRPTPAIRHAFNSLDENGQPSSDWNPLDPSSWKRRN